MTDTKHVAVLMGGWSPEREVSLASGQACADALERVGYRVSRVDAGRDLAAVLTELAPDVAFNALNQLDRLVFLARVRAEGMRDAAIGLDLRAKVAQRLGLAPGDADLEPLARKAPGDRPAEPGSPPEAPPS